MRIIRIKGRGAPCAAVPKLSTKTSHACANSAVPKLGKVYAGVLPIPGQATHVYQTCAVEHLSLFKTKRVSRPPPYYCIMNWVGCQEKFWEILKKLSTGFPQKKHKIFLDSLLKILIIYIMKNENKRPTKKALVKMLEERGVEKEIVASLQRANIDTLIWVLNKIS